LVFMANMENADPTQDIHSSCLYQHHRTFRHHYFV
jgi:hypothetical protein